MLGDLLMKGPMPLEQVQLDGDAARIKVRAHWPGATSCYTGPTADEVYDEESGIVLGSSQGAEFSVEHAWVAAANLVRLDSQDARYVSGGGSEVGSNGA